MAADPRPKPFRDILRDNNHFLVPPLQWNSRHLDLVGCRFEDVATLDCTKSTENRDGGHSQGRSAKQPNDVEDLAMHLSPIIKRQRLINILAGEEGRFASPRKGAPFYFQGRLVHQPEYRVFHRHERSIDHVHDSSPPVVGYVHYTDVNGARDRQFRPCPGPKGFVNYVGWEICKKRVAQTTPKEWTEDPYFLCHLLALAQLQERKLKPSDPVTYTSRLLVTNALDKEHILFYEAQITTELLDALRDPKTATMPMEWPAIRRKKIPYKPYDTFADRLVAELVAPCPLSSSNSPPSVSPSTSTDNVNHVSEHGQKRLHEQEDSRSYKVRRTSKGIGGPLIEDQGAGELSVC